jgi:hypothetical protein
MLREQPAAAHDGRLGRRGQHRIRGGQEVRGIPQADLAQDRLDDRAVAGVPAVDEAGDLHGLQRGDLPVRPGPGHGDHGQRRRPGVEIRGAAVQQRLVGAGDGLSGMLRHQPIRAPDELGELRLDRPRLVRQADRQQLNAQAVLSHLVQDRGGAVAPAAKRIENEGGDGHSGSY